MAGAKEIRTKIKSVKNTQKITRAMEKVAMAKMRKAQDRMASARPLAEKLRRTPGHIAQANRDYSHPLRGKTGRVKIKTGRGRQVSTRPLPEKKTPPPGHTPPPKLLVCQHLH